VKRGAGTLYWSATAQYYDTSESFAQRGSHELALNRRYFSLVPIRRDHRIVYRETPFDGTASPGDLLLVRLVAAGAGDLRYLVLDDPIPAGTEPVTNPEAYTLERPNRWWRANRPEYRDSRVVFFQDRFDQGRSEYSYLLRVVTPGRFRAMPARVSPMYVPDVSASSTGQGVVVAETIAASTTTESGSEK
jgi:uncharacterized protein YfaS (alpha-2-macroglobulin family)